MEGGQKSSIDLESGLDVRASDQLVPVNSPLFQHNRQQFQGSVLPTSLRYEHNGWAAGWDVYEFEVSNASVETSPVGFSVTAARLNSNPTYIFQIKSGTVTAAQVWHNGADIIKTGTFTITHDEEAPYLVTIAGDNNGHGYEILINMLTGDISYDDTEWIVTQSSYHEATSSAGETELQVIDLLSWVQFNCAVILPEDAAYGNVTVAPYYSCTTEDGETVHVWKDTTSSDGWEISYNSTTGACTVNGEEAEATVDMSSGRVAVTYAAEYSGEISTSPATETFYLQIYDISVSQSMTQVSSSGTGTAIETWSAQHGGASYLYPTDATGRAAYIYGNIPIWAGLRMMLHRDTGRSPLDIIQMDFAEGVEPSGDARVYSAALYFLTSDKVMFYESAFFGSSAQFWIDCDERLADFGTFSSSFDNKDAIYAAMTYCACTFNRIRCVTDEDGEVMSSYDVPVTAGLSNESGLEITEDAPWHDGGTFANKQEGESYFEAGFYIGVAELGVGYVQQQGGGYVLVPDDFPVEEYRGQYVTLSVYNAQLEAAALQERANAYMEFFVSVEGGAYVCRTDYDYADDVAGYLPDDGWDFFTLEEWNAAVAAWNEAHAEEEEIAAVDAGAYGIVQLSLEDTEYARESEGWFILGSKDYSPDAYDASEVADAASIGISGEWEGYARLEPPFAYYGVEVTGAGFDGNRYEAYTSSPKEAGEASSDLVLELQSSSFTDSDGKTYWFGDYEANCLLPYFRTLSSEDDTRSIQNIDSSSVSNVYGSVSVSFDSGPLALLSATMTGEGTSYNVTEGDLYSLATGDYGFWDEFKEEDSLGILRINNTHLAFKVSESDFSEANNRGNWFNFRHLVREWMSIDYVIECFPNSSYLRRGLEAIKEALDAQAMQSGMSDILVTGSTSYNIRVWGQWDYNRFDDFSEFTEDYVYLEFYGVSATYGTLSVSGTVSYDGSRVASASADGGSDITSAMASALGIAPEGAYMLCEGFGNPISSDADTSSMYLAWCFPGRYQFSMRMLNTDDRTFSQSNFSSLIDIQASGDSELVYGTGFYIDRDADDSSDSGCTKFGVQKVQLSRYIASVSGSQVTMTLYFKPVLSGDDYVTFCLQYVSDAEEGCYVPGQVYYGAEEYFNSGYNLKGLKMQSGYSATSLAVSVTAGTAAFYRPSSMRLSWNAESGIHDFYTSVLPSAASSASVTRLYLESPAHSGNGSASIAQHVVFSCLGEEMQLLFEFVMTAGEGTTNITLQNEPITLSYMGYDFTFILQSYLWESGSSSVVIGVTVPLEYALSMRLPYQLSYSESISYDEDSGTFLIDGEEFADIPVGTIAIGYDPLTYVYEFETEDGQSYEYSVNDDTFVYGMDSYEYSLLHDALIFSVNSYEAFSLLFVLEGAYKASGAEIVSFDGESITVLYEGTEYTFNFSELLDEESPNSFVYSYTDTRDGSVPPKAVTFAIQDTTDEFQFLRQTWDTTVAVENYWWIDSSTILELNKHSLVVKRKVDAEGDETIVDVDDWGGDAWEDVYSFSRTEYIDNTVVRYGVTSAYGGAVPRFWTVQVASTSNIRINFYELLQSGSSWSFSKVSCTIGVNVVPLGTVLNDPDAVLRLNTYSQLSAETVAYDAKYSATVIGEHILFGIHCDNNYNQWALDITLDGTIQQVVQGYGYVGLNGCLTGGEIPERWFSADRGFNDAVMPISVLEQEDIEYVSSASAFKQLDAEGTVAGDESQQWYITANLTGIISHLEWDTEDSVWEAVSLPISCTYSCTYGSPSYGTRVISCFDMFIESLDDLLDIDTLYDDKLRNNVEWNTWKVYGYCPKVSTMLYLQQTMGQYAYVHYNSQTPGKQKDLSRENTSEESNSLIDKGFEGYEYTAIGLKKWEGPEEVDAVTPENSDDFSFNLHGLRQSVAVKNPWQSSDSALAKFVLLLLSGIVNFSNALTQSVSPVNLLQNQMSAGDVGRRFSQAFLKNLDSMASAQAYGLGSVPTQQSAVACSCTMDMFYSTSEGQKISAGPGWVNHNMVAQCVAQSVTSNQMEMNQIGMVWVMEGLSTLVMKWVIFAAELTYKTAVDVANLSAQVQAMGTNVAAGVAAGTILVASIAYTTAVSVLQPVVDMVDALIASINEGAQVQVQNALSKHVYSMEGKHNYGQKSEVFMWPCFGVSSRVDYTNEKVKCKAENYQWKFSLPLQSSHGGSGVLSLGTIDLQGVTTESQPSTVTEDWEGDVSYLIANCSSELETVQLPSDMAAVTGSDSFLPPVPFRNENIGVSEPVFPTPPLQDYIIDKDWELGQCASQSMTVWISCKDTKLIDGDASNIVVSDDFCGVACSYSAIEVRRGMEQKYVRPWAITPNAIALNNTGFNACYEEKAYHAFDGQGGRIVKWCGAPGMNKEGRVLQYAFLSNDRFKRSNKMPPNEFIGNFKGDPIIALKTTGDDRVVNLVTDTARGRGLEAGVTGEDKDVRRYAAPVFTELVSTLPAVLKTTSSFNLSVIDGITSLTSDNTDKQTAYKAPVSVDFAIGRNKYRFTNEYIAQLEVDPLKGVTTLKEQVPTLGLEFLGATPYEAYLYSQAARQYYVYSGGTSLSAAGMLERFRDIIYGRYDFVNQEVAMPCVATFKRLDKHVFDDEDERDNTIVPRLKSGRFVGEMPPPIETIYNMRSGFKTISLPSGLCYQGPNRCIITSFVYSDYMKDQIRSNYGKWKRVPRERYHPFRDYGMEYERVDEFLNSQVTGWTHNPFLLVTSPLGVASETDCIYEWEITFAWPVEMDALYDEGNYATVNIMGECFTPGGKVIPDRPAHVFLWRDLFTRTGNYGYYSYRYQSRCGAGNRERLHIWSDQYIAISSLQLEYKAVTEKRTEVLTQQLDVQEMTEI